MPALRENALTKVASKTGVSLNTTVKTSLFIVPTGKTFVATHVLVRNVSGPAPAADADFGIGAAANDFRASVQFDNLAATGDGVMVTPYDGGASTPVPGKVETYAAGDDFGIKVGTVVAVTVDVDVFGWLF
ncbi:MAG: hypothetical protein V3U03_17560 [Myxococcota bacterium]